MKSTPTYNDYFRAMVQIGFGSYGEVYKCIDRQSNATVVIKIMKIFDESDGVNGSTLREVSILQTLKHPNIVSFQRIIHIQDRPVLVLEACQTDLFQYLKLKNRLEKVEVNNIMMQLLKGLQYLHEHSIIHRDLKTSNCLLSFDPLQVKIADFGLAKYQDNNQNTTKVVTLYYRPPEVLNGCANQTPAIDIFSAGCIWAEMTTGNILFDSENEQDQISKIQGLDLGSIKTWFQPSELEVLRQMLQLDPDDRPTCQQIIEELSRIQ